MLVVYEDLGLRMSVQATVDEGPSACVAYFGQEILGSNILAPAGNEDLAVNWD